MRKKSKASKYMHPFENPIQLSYKLRREFRREFEYFQTCFMDLTSYRSCTVDIRGLIIEKIYKETGITRQQAEQFARYNAQMQFACSTGLQSL